MKGSSRAIEMAKVVEKRESCKSALENKKGVPESVKELKSERKGEWPLHVTVTSEMTPFFFAMDRQNYAKWLPFYLAEMAAISSKHPLIHKEFLDRNHSVSRSQHPFSKVSTDMALEQSINRDSKSKSGIIGISQNPNALDQWFVTNHERAAITTAFKEMCSLNDPNGNSAHKENSSKRIHRDENDVQKLLTCFDSGLMTNPFSRRSRPTFKHRKWCRPSN
ncbi:hypothetical protein ACROYT_G025664 [Oculina patagonica]